MIYYISHPNVKVDPDTPVPRWGLDNEGRRRMQAMLSQAWVPAITRVVSSDETKAVEAATILADHLGQEVEVRPDTGENDRSATGFVPPDEFERLADAFFADPEVSVQGWERAIDAQQRIVAGVADLLSPISFRRSPFAGQRSARRCRHHRTWGSWHSLVLPSGGCRDLSTSRPAGPGLLLRR